MTYIAQEMHRWKELRARLLTSMPELADDPDCLLDTLDGLSDLKEQLAGLLRSALRDEAMARGLKEYQQQLADRKAAFDRRASKKRAVALHFMEEIDLKKIEAPDLTATRKRIQPGVNVYGEPVLPDEYWRVKREPDLQAIREALKAGKDVPGAQLKNAGETLQIKV